eukprot:6193466-Pleurochrysis_carterae.AAC.1
MRLLLRAPLVERSCEHVRVRASVRMGLGASMRACKRAYERAYARVCENARARVYDCAGVIVDVIARVRVHVRAAECVSMDVDSLACAGEQMDVFSACVRVCARTSVGSSV